MMTEISSIEQEYRDALERLVRGQPQSERLAAQLERNGYLPVTITNVAFEAGRSRTPIGYKGCKYPATRAMVIRAIQDSGAISTASEANKRARQRNAELVEQLALSRTAQAAALARVVALEKELERERARRRRAERELDKAGSSRPRVVKLADPDR